ncbi:hypothetical protein D3C83_34570 [compost metagenome]
MAGTPWKSIANENASPAVKLRAIVTRSRSFSCCQMSAFPASVTDVTVMPLPPEGGVAAAPPRPPPPGSAQGSAKPFVICAGRGCALNLHKSSSTVFTPAWRNVRSTPCFTTSSLFWSLSV